jgi:hypothetical protein
MIGMQNTAASVNMRAGALAIQLRNVCQDMKNFQEWILTLGETGLDQLGFTPADATSILNAVSYMNTISSVFFGTGTQGTVFDFDNALAALYGGQ